MIWLRDSFNAPIPPNNYMAVFQHLLPENRSVSFTYMGATSNYFSCEFEAREIGDHHISVVVRDQNNRYYWVYGHTLTITEDSSATLRVFGSGSVMVNRIPSANQYEGMSH